MYAKTLTLLVVIVAAAALAREYPAGVHPAVCPDYPFCDPETLARFTPAGIPIPQWGLYPGFRAADPSVGIPAQYPAGLNPALCPNYPYC